LVGELVIHVVRLIVIKEIMFINIISEHLYIKLLFYSCLGSIDK